MRWRKHRGNDDIYQIFLNIPCKNSDMVTNCFPEQVYQPWIDLFQQYPPTEGPEREYYDTFNDFNLRRENDYDDAPGSFRGSERASHFISGPGDILKISSMHHLTTSTLPSHKGRTLTISRDRASQTSNGMVPRTSSRIRRAPHSTLGRLRQVGTSP